MKFNIPCRSNPMPFYTTSSIGPDYETMPITFEAIGGSSTIKLAQVGSPNTANLSYKKNSGEWTTYSINSTIDLAEGDTVSFSGSNTSFSKGFQSNYYQFQSTGSNQIVYGNLMSLVNWQTQVGANMFNTLFRYNTNIVDASNMILPLNTASQCYVWMLENCTNLSAGPYFLAPTFSDGCYWAMCDYNGMKKAYFAGTNQPGSRTFQNTFNHNSALSAVEVCFTTWGSNGVGIGTVAANGIFIKPSGLARNGNIPSNWTILTRDSNNVLWTTDSTGAPVSEYTGEDPFADLF